MSHEGAEYVMCYMLCLQRRIYVMFAFSERHVTVCHYNDKRSRDRLSL